jgi:hypothetical protein
VSPRVGHSHSDEFYCFRHRHEALHLAATPGHAVWVFNVWAEADLLNAIYQGQIGVRIGPESLGTAFYIPTVVVPALLVTHGLIFWLLLRPKGIRRRTQSCVEILPGQLA